VTIESVLVGLVILAALYLAVVAGLMLTGRGALAREVATFLPNLVMLFRGLGGDPRVPRRAKIALAIAAVWLASPIDLIPEFIPIAGPLDDAIVAAVVLRYVLRSTDRAVVDAHWRGDPKTLERLLALARIPASDSPIPPPDR
jgi:uncharacterized membrane protein YkvA (DUF1232 family)